LLSYPHGFPLSTADPMQFYHHRVPCADPALFQRSCVIFETPPIELELSPGSFFVLFLQLYLDIHQSVGVHHSHPDDLGTDFHVDVGHLVHDHLLDLVMHWLFVLHVHIVEHLLHRTDAGVVSQHFLDDNRLAICHCPQQQRATVVYFVWVGVSGNGEHLRFVIAFDSLYEGSVISFLRRYSVGVWVAHNNEKSKYK